MGRPALLSICCQNVVKTRNECKYMLFSPIAEYEKSPITRASSMVAATDLIVHIREHLPILLGTRVTALREPQKRKATR